MSDSCWGFNILPFPLFCVDWSIAAELKVATGAGPWDHMVLTHWSSLLSPSYLRLEWSQTLSAAPVAITTNNQQTLTAQMKKRCPKVQGRLQEEGSAHPSCWSQLQVVVLMFSCLKACCSCCWHARVCVCVFGQGGEQLGLWVDTELLPLRLQSHKALTAECDLPSFLSYSK